jgi:hypothetical protein
MKKTSYVLTAICLIAALACNKPSDVVQDDAMEEIDEDLTETLYAVPLDTAMKDIQYYDTVSKEILKVIPIQSFTIRSVDLVEAMGLPPSAVKKAPFKYVRVYLGMNSKNQFKLYLTPVVGADLNANPPVAGRDSILVGKYDGLGNSGAYMLDFTAPCPTTCPQ